MLCKTRRALWRNIGRSCVHGSKSTKRFRVTVWPENRHEATCPFCRQQPFAHKLSSWRAMGRRRLLWRYMLIKNH